MPKAHRHERTGVTTTTGEQFTLTEDPVGTVSVTDHVLDEVQNDAIDATYVDLDTMTYSELQAELRAAGLPVSGSKAELVTRLEEHLDNG